VPGWLNRPSINAGSTLPNLERIPEARMCFVHDRSSVERRQCTKATIITRAISDTLAIHQREIPIVLSLLRVCPARFFAGVSWKVPGRANLRNFPQVFRHSPYVWANTRQIIFGVEVDVCRAGPVNEQSDEGCEKVFMVAVSGSMFFARSQKSGCRGPAGFEETASLQSGSALGFSPRMPCGVYGIHPASKNWPMPGRTETSGDIILISDSRISGARARGKLFVLPSRR